jgi:hypothetical protein
MQIRVCCCGRTRRSDHVVRVADQLHNFQDWSAQNTHMYSDEAIYERTDSDFLARQVHRLANDLQMVYNIPLILR